MRLYGAGRTELVEVALGHLGEHAVERAAVVVEHAQPVRVELAAQEPVHELELDHHVDEVEHLAPDEHVGPVAVHPEPGHRVQMVHDVAHFRPPGRLGRYVPRAGHHVLLAVRLQVEPLQPVDQQRDGARFVRAPQQVRQIEHYGLAEQHERHPLVVRVVHGLGVPLGRPDARVRRVVDARQRVRGGEEAERVDDVRGHAGGYAPDVLADVLAAAHQRGARQQHGEREPIVDAERRVVDGDQTDPGEPGMADDGAEHADHIDNILRVCGAENRKLHYYFRLISRRLQTYFAAFARAYGKNARAARTVRKTVNIYNSCGDGRARNTTTGPRAPVATAAAAETPTVLRLRCIVLGDGSDGCRGTPAQRPPPSRQGPREIGAHVVRPITSLRSAVPAWMDG